MAAKPSLDVAAAFSRATALYHQGQFKEAASLYRKILAADPAHFDTNHMLGVLRARQGRYVEAAEALANALKAMPHNAEALSNYGNVLTVLGHFEEALMAYEAALSLNPQPVFWFNRGLVLMNLRRFEDAVASHDAALSLAPDYAEAFQSRAAACCELGRFNDALSSADAALRLKPDFVDAFYIRGVALWRLRRFEAALDSYNLALGIAPRAPMILNSRGILLCSMGRYDTALESFDAALAVEPGLVDLLVNRGIALASLHRYQDALDSFERALEIKPDYAEALTNKGSVLAGLERFDEALDSFAAVLKQSPDDSNALFNSATTLSLAGRFEEALARFDATLAANPRHPHALSGMAGAALNLCDWARTGPLAGRLATAVREDQSVVSPFTLLSYGADAALQLRCTQLYLQDKGAQCREGARPGPYSHDRIRIAYVSSDFGDHPVSHQLVEVLERHDRSRFEISGISLGAEDGSAVRARLVKAFDRFTDARLMQDRDIADLMRAQEIDIAVDLNGHTQNGRPEIFAHRAAPVQVNYLGYPATSGSACMDYILADAVVAPFADQPVYSEAIVHLRGSYFVLDSDRVLPAPLARQDAGLPETGIVFCCFNQNWKITAPLFEAWMRLLREVPGSVLWLRDAGDAVRANLRREAQAREIDPDRLIFAGSVGFEQHMARLQLADIFLDTLPYGAHATASDALWAGVPVVTRKGETFAGRVGTSLLLAAGLPELVTGSLAEYEALALKLAQDPVALAALRERLTRIKAKAPLFDTDRSRQNIEAAYRQMMKLAGRGEPPASFSVTEAGEIRRAGADQLAF
ncbi:MAG: tetratricopeptide repeat protein [Pseudomonadota bacterium]